VWLNPASIWLKLTRKVGSPSTYRNDSNTEDRDLENQMNDISNKPPVFDNDGLHNMIIDRAARRSPLTSGFIPIRFNGGIESMRDHLKAAGFAARIYKRESHATTVQCIYEGQTFNVLPGGFVTRWQGDETQIPISQHARGSRPGSPGSTERTSKCH
jgi:hypothetical protein